METQNNIHNSKSTEGMNSSELADAWNFSDVESEEDFLQGEHLLSSTIRSKGAARSAKQDGLCNQNIIMASARDQAKRMEQTEEETSNGCRAQGGNLEAEGGTKGKAHEDIKSLEHGAAPEANNSSGVDTGEGAPGEKDDSNKEASLFGTQAGPFGSVAVSKYMLLSDKEAAEEAAEDARDQVAAEIEEALEQVDIDEEAEDERDEVETLVSTHGRQAMMDMMFSNTLCPPPGYEGCYSLGGMHGGYRIETTRITYPDGTFKQTRVKTRNMSTAGATITFTRLSGRNLSTEPVV